VTVTDNNGCATQRIYTVALKPSISAKYNYEGSEHICISIEVNSGNKSKGNNDDPDVLNFEIYYSYNSGEYNLLQYGGASSQGNLVHIDDVCDMPIGNYNFYVKDYFGNTSDIFNLNVPEIPDSQ
jgi:hypothetical protein